MDVAFPRVSLIILGFSLCNICSVPEPGLLLTFSFSHLFFFSDCLYKPNSSLHKYLGFHPHLPSWHVSLCQLHGKLDAQVCVKCFRDSES